MTSTGTKLAPPIEISVRSTTTVPPFPASRNTLPRDDATITTGKVTYPRELISRGLFSKLTYRVANDNGYGMDTAERIVEQALAFLLACARYPDGHLSPSGTVDAGWHAFILHTADYTEFCHRIAGRYIHHRPDGPGGKASEQQAIGATIAAMRDACLPVDPDLWVPRSESLRPGRGSNTGCAE